MVKQVRKPSPAMVVACLALFVALTGTSVAVVNVLPKNSVGTAQLKKDAVVSSKIKDASLKAVDFAAGQLPAGPTGPRGHGRRRAERRHRRRRSERGPERNRAHRRRRRGRPELALVRQSSRACPARSPSRVEAGRQVAPPQNLSSAPPRPQAAIRRRVGPPVMSTYGSSGSATLTAYVICVKKP